MNLTTLTLDEFRKFPLVKLGESKEIREHPEDPDKVVIWLRPTIYSFTQNRCGWVEGSNLLRARVLRVLIPMLKEAGIDHAYEEISESGFITARRIYPEMDPGVEVILKRYNGGTSHYRYLGMDKHPTRTDHPFWPGSCYGNKAPYNDVKIRFDWRNPFWNPDLVAEVRSQHPGLPVEVFEWPAELRTKVMMRDEVLGEDFADELIDVRQARRTALWTMTVLQSYMARCDIVIHDLCLFITTDGRTVYGEINQDCGRFRHLDHGMLDKDVWRSGGTQKDVLQKWALLAWMLENPVHPED